MKRFLGLIKRNVSRLVLVKKQTLFFFNLKLCACKFIKLNVKEFPQLHLNSSIFLNYETV